MSSMPLMLAVAAMVAALAVLAVPASQARDAVAAPGPPALPLPPGVQAVEIGEDMRIDGLAVQVRGFLSPDPPARLAAWFRLQLGDAAVASAHGGKILLGHFRHGYYLTVQLEDAAGGTRGLLAQSDMRGLMAGRAPPAARAKWQSRLPDNMRILSLVESRDGLRDSQHLVLQSDAMLADSAHGVRRMLGRSGYAPVRAQPDASPRALVLYFQGPGRDAISVLEQAADGSTRIVLSASAPAGEAR